MWLRAMINYGTGVSLFEFKRLFSVFAVPNVDT